MKDLLKNRNVVIGSSLIIAAYVGLVNSDNMPLPLSSFVNSPIGKILVLALVAYLGDKQPTLSLMLAVALCVSLTLSQNREHFSSEEEEHNNHESFDAHGEDESFVGGSPDGEGENYMVSGEGEPFTGNAHDGEGENLMSPEEPDTFMGHGSPSEDETAGDATSGEGATAANGEGFSNYAPF